MERPRKTQPLPDDSLSNDCHLALCLCTKKLALYTESHSLLHHSTCLRMRFVCNTSAFSALVSASPTTGYFSRTIFPVAASLASSFLSRRGRDQLVSSAQQHAMQLQQRTALHQTAAQHAAASRHAVVPCASLGALKAHQPCRNTGALPFPASHWGSSLVRPSFAASPLQHSRCARACGPCQQHMQLQGPVCGAAHPS